MRLGGGGGTRNNLRGNQLRAGGKDVLIFHGHDPRTIHSEIPTHTSTLFAAEGKAGKAIIKWERKFASSTASTFHPNGGKLMAAKPLNGGKLARHIYPAGKLATAQPPGQPRHRRPNQLRPEHVAQHVLGRLNRATFPITPACATFHGSKGFAESTFGDFDEPKFMPEYGSNLPSNVDDFADIEMPSSTAMPSGAESMPSCPWQALGRLASDPSGQPLEPPPGGYSPETPSFSSGRLNTNMLARSRQQPLSEAPSEELPKPTMPRSVLSQTVPPGNAFNVGTNAGTHSMLGTNSTLAMLLQNPGSPVQATMRSERSPLQSMRSVPQGVTWDKGGLEVLDSKIASLAADRSKDQGKKKNETAALGRSLGTQVSREMGGIFKGASSKNLTQTIEEQPEAGDLWEVMNPGSGTPPLSKAERDRLGASRSPTPPPEEDSSSGLVDQDASSFTGETSVVVNDATSSLAESRIRDKLAALKRNLRGTTDDLLRTTDAEFL